MYAMKCFVKLREAKKGFGDDVPKRVWAAAQRFFAFEIGINSSEAADEMRPQLRYVYGKGAEKVDRRLTFQTAVICDTMNHVLAG